MLSVLIITQWVGKESAFTCISKLMNLIRSEKYNYLIENGATLDLTNYWSTRLTLMRFRIIFIPDRILWTTVIHKARIFSLVWFTNEELYFFSFLTFEQSVSYNLKQAFIECLLDCLGELRVRKKAKMYSLILKHTVYKAIENNLAWA